MPTKPSTFATAVFLTSALMIPPAVTADEMSDEIDAARADLDALYKGDYRAAFVTKNPELFTRHIAPELQYSSYDGSTGTAEDLKGFVAARIATIERVLDHNVTIEHVQIDAGRIAAVVTLTTVLDVRSPAGAVYRELSVGTYRDAFTRQPDGSLLEVSAQLLRSHTAIAPIP